MMTHMNILAVALGALFGTGLTLMSCGQGDGPTTGSRSTGYGHGLRCADRVPGGRTNRHLDSEHGRSVPGCSGGDQQRQCGRAARKRSPRDQLGRRRLHSHRHRGNAVHRLPGDPRRPLHHTGDGFRASPTLRPGWTTFHNPTYETIFQPFSPVRLFSPIESNVTEVNFFVPGPDSTPATTNGFGAVFTDVDHAGWERAWQEARKPQGQHADRVLRHRRRSALQQLRPGLAGRCKPFLLRHRLSRRAHRPGADHERRCSRRGRMMMGRDDIVMMDDFLYGEPQPLH